MTFDNTVNICTKIKCCILSICMATSLIIFCGIYLEIWIRKMVLAQVNMYIN